MISPEEARRLALDDSLNATAGHHTVVVGCGNLLRGDDAVGPTLIRHLWERDIGDVDGVTLVDGGTAGMDVAFKMRGARRVILVDASVTGAEPGTVYRLPGEEVEQLPPLQGLHSHQFRWDHALAFAHWLLADAYPEHIVVFLIEAAQTEPGAPLSPPVAAAMEQVIALITELIDDESIGGPSSGSRNSGEPEPALPESGDEGVTDGPVTDGPVAVEFSQSGDLRLTADIADRWFPTESLVAVRRHHELWLFPLIGPEGGGLLLKQRNARGDRSALVWEQLEGATPTGRRAAFWDDENKALRVDIGSSEA